MMWKFLQRLFGNHIKCHNHEGLKGTCGPATKYGRYPHDHPVHPNRIDVYCDSCFGNDPDSKLSAPGGNGTYVLTPEIRDEYIVQEIMES